MRKIVLFSRFSMFSMFSMLMFLWLSTMPTALTAQTPNLQEQLKDLEVGDHWIYNDFQAAVAKAKSQDKPLFVLFR